MDYPTYRANGYQIGSGTIESACKQIVTQRLKVASAIWELENAIKTAKARAAWLSGQWSSLVGRRERLTLPLAAEKHIVRSPKIFRRSFSLTKFTRLSKLSQTTPTCWVHFSLGEMWGNRAQREERRMRMKKNRAQLKAEFMAEAEELFDELMEWDEQTEKPNLTQIEEIVLALRKRMGERMAQQVIMRQEERQSSERMKYPKCGEGK
jgi:hypothetical protein